MSLQGGSGEARRNAALAGVLAAHPTWHHTMMAFVRSDLPTGWVGMGEDIVVMAAKLAPNIGPPPSPACVGSLTNHAQKHFLLESTGVFQKPQGPKSHASKKQVWRRTTIR